PDDLIEESELDAIAGECDAEEVCNGVDDDCNDVIDDVMGTPYCGDGCCNNEETSETCDDCICRPPLTPVLAAPRNGEKLQTPTPLFQWLRASGSCGAPRYHLQVDDVCIVAHLPECEFADPAVDEKDVETTSFQPAEALALPEELPRVARYFWRVRSCYDGEVCSEWSLPKYVDIGRTESDLDGDGVPDIAVGIELADGTAVDEGKVHVFYWDEPVHYVPPSLVIHNPFANTSAFFGYSLDGRGDLNGDGYGDLVVGAPGQDGVESEEGAVFVYYGYETGISGEPLVILRSPEHQQWSGFGAGVTSSGDFNGDRLSDVAVGAERMEIEAGEEGAVYVYYGSLEGISEDADLTLHSPYHQEGGRFGASLASAGDLNRDGFDDLSVGAYMHDGALAGQGVVFVFFGSSEGLSEEASIGIDCPDDFALRFGQSVTSSGDLNGDGYDDLAVGSPGVGEEAFESGGLFIIYGNDVDFSVYLFDAVNNPDEAGTQGLGTSTAIVGDVNMDGYDDVAAGALGRPGVYGKVFMFEGTQEFSVRRPGRSIVGTVDDLGHDITPAGDLNADGVSDFVLTSQLTTGDEGALVYYGMEFCCRLFLE
ncbi:MAG: VCBS repeat-containing protein, partial [Pseudomonadota bacterium]